MEGQLQSYKYWAVAANSSLARNIVPAACFYQWLPESFLFLTPGASTFIPDHCLAGSFCLTSVLDLSTLLGLTLYPDFLCFNLWTSLDNTSWNLPCIDSWPWCLDLLPEILTIVGIVHQTQMLGVFLQFTVTGPHDRCLILIYHLPLHVYISLNQAA